MSQEPGMAALGGTAPEIEPLEQELLRLLQSEAVRGYLRQATGAILSPARPAAPPELSAAGAIAEQLQQMIRHMSSEALQALAGDRSTPAAGDD
jgi:hypothetical protein